MFVTCRILLKKSGSRTPRIELEEIGPAFDFVIRRSKLGSELMYKDAMKVSRTIKVATACIMSGRAYHYSQTLYNRLLLLFYQTQMFRRLNFSSFEILPHCQYCESVHYSK